MRSAVVLVMALGCAKSVPSIPPEVDVWARSILAKPIADVCAGDLMADFFCNVQRSLITDEVRQLGANYVSLQDVHSNERYIDLDWGGGHVEAHGVVIGQANWMPTPNAENNHRRIRDGVFSYDSRQ